MTNGPGYPLAECLNHSLTPKDQWTNGLLEQWTNGLIRLMVQLILVILDISGQHCILL